MINDDKLTLYFYGDELDEATRAQVESGLAGDPELAARYAALCAELTALGGAVAPVNVPAPLNEALHAALIRIATPAPPAAASRWLPWSLAATVALAALLLTLTQRAPQTSPNVAPGTVVHGTPAGVSVEGSIEGSRTRRLVHSHLAQSRLQLVRYEAVSADQRSALVEELIAQNRATESSAQRAGDNDLARVLRAFEPVLEQLLGNATDGTANREQLLEQLNFELGAMLTKLDAPASDSALSL